MKGLLKHLAFAGLLIAGVASCQTPRASVVLDDVRDSSMLIIDEHDAYVARTEGGSWAALTEEEAVSFKAQSAAFRTVFDDADGVGWVLVGPFEALANPVFGRYSAWVSEEFPYDPTVDPIEPLDRRVRLRSVQLVQEYLSRVKGG